jgi:hypothetical protein
MKKNVMALSIAAMIGGLGFAGAASADVVVGTGAGTVADYAVNKINTPTATALAVTAGGVGHALVVPYFNAQNGNMTVLHITNTDQVNGKVAKVRFRSASNSDDLLDFQVFLSPGDVWTAAVTADANGLAQITTADNTCTVPALTTQSFNNSTSRLPGYLTEAQRTALTREGYVEVFNVADITALKAYDAAGALAAAGPNRSALYTATKHVSGVAPCSVAGSTARSTLNAAAIADYTTQAQIAAAGLDSPTGGLMGDWYIINVPQTTVFSGAATAIAANTGAGVNGVANFRHFAQLGNTLVTLGADGANGVTADPLFRTLGVYNAAGTNVTTATLPMLNYDAPDLSTPFFGAATSPNAVGQANNLLAALAVKSVTNQYALDASITAKTDWVFSMPARRYNVVANYAAVTGTSGATGPTSSNPGYRLFTDVTNVGTVAAPVVAGAQAGNRFYTAGANNVAAAGGAFKSVGNTTVDTNGNICVFADGQKFFDREETSATAGPVFSPGTASSVAFCGEVSVLAFSDTGNSVLGASVARSTITSGIYTNGWGVIDTSNAALGLPLLGNSFIKLTNPQAGVGVSGTYGISWPHRYTK